jgi:hypothetical protein
MESVIQKIQEARGEKIKTRAGTQITETIVDGCPVKIRFDAVGDGKAMVIIRSMLMSAHLDAALTATPGGESA